MPPLGDITQFVFVFVFVFVRGLQLPESRPVRNFLDKEKGRICTLFATRSVICMYVFETIGVLVG